MNKNYSISAATLFACLSITPTFSNASSFDNFIKNTEINGNIELEASFSEDYAGATTSDFTLATAEISIYSEITKQISTNFLLLDEKGTPLEVDEAFINIKIKKPITLTAGRLYIPFGNYETNMISDSLPLEIGEARETTIQLEYEKKALTASFYIFDGNVQENGASSTIEKMGFNIAYYTTPLTIGLSYINDLADSNLINESITTDQSVVSYTPGISIYATAVFDKTSVFFEYISALEEFNMTDLAFNSTGAKPAAINLEIGYKTAKSIYAAALQSSTEAIALDLPETRLLLSYTMKIQKKLSLKDNYTLAFELASDANYSGDKASAFTAQLAVAF